MMSIKFYVPLFLSIFLMNPGYADSRMDVGLFSEQQLDGWKQKKFSGETHYALQSVNDQFVISADSQQSASAFYKKIKVDLQQTPFLNWSWYKKQSIKPGNELEKEGDDFVSRIYVIKDGGFFFWKTLAINYVWSDQHSRGETWDNPFAGSHAKMVSQRDASDGKEIWFSEKRNVLMDFKKLFGKTITSIDGVAIMTDSDNSGLSAKAYYGDIFFTAE